MPRLNRKAGARACEVALRWEVPEPEMTHHVKTAPKHECLIRIPIMIIISYCRRMFLTSSFASFSVRFKIVEEYAIRPVQYDAPRLYMLGHEALRTVLWTSIESRVGTSSCQPAIVQISGIPGNTLHVS